MHALGLVWEWLQSHLCFDLALLVALVTVLIVTFSRRSVDSVAPRGGRRLSSSVLARPRRVVASVFGALIFCALLVLEFAEKEAWLYLLAFIPTGMVLYQGLAVAIFKNKQFFDDSQGPPKAPETAQAFLQPLMSAAWNEERRYYSSSSLALRFGLPALLLGTVALTGALCLLDAHFCGEQLPAFVTPEQQRQVFAAARLGLAGAYIYVVMYLGNRSFRADVTPGAALWSTLTLAVGPVFAAVLVYIYEPQLDDRWTAHIVPFAAGFSLRFMADVVEAAIRRLVGGSAENTARSVPLSQIRGISKDVEQRLAEEGIENVQELAMANPHRLRRNTSYDKRQIVAWIDQALIMTYLPLAWQTLESEGITGAIDLVWYVHTSEAPDVAAANAFASDPVPVVVVTLAKRNKLDPESLWQAMMRMHSDQQVQMIWALYQFDDGETDRSAAPAYRPDGAPNEPEQATGLASSG